MRIRQYLASKYSPVWRSMLVNPQERGQTELGISGLGIRYPQLSPLLSLSGSKMAPVVLWGGLIPQNCRQSQTLSPVKATLGCVASSAKTSVSVPTWETSGGQTTPGCVPTAFRWFLPDKLVHHIPSSLVSLHTRSHLALRSVHGTSIFGERCSSILI